MKHINTGKVYKKRLFSRDLILSSKMLKKKDDEFNIKIEIAI